MPWSNFNPGQTSEEMRLLSAPFSQTWRPRVPTGIRIFAVGDIHGRLDLLDRVLKAIDSDVVEFPIGDAVEVFVGDYVDRGPDSRQVLDRLIARSCTRRTIFLRGNHEVFLAQFIHNPSILRQWQRIGGLETLMSYGLSPSINADTATQDRLATGLDQAMPFTHRRFLDELKTSFTCGDFYFVHAGVRPGVPLAEQRQEDLLWIRQEFLLHKQDYGKIIVHGHTPAPHVEVHTNRINIDTGAYATGNLTCLVLEGDTIRLI
jgi:serine/threonine protein phosphatase 1